tara:strand:+ start:82 stop:357 length:276 start_codon:yes stop_codon:yes gene_type:complete
MALEFKKIATSNTAKNIFVTFVKPNMGILFNPIPKPKPKPKPESYYTYKTYFMEHYSIIEIPPPPYCNICNKYITHSYCQSVVKQNYCPYK